MFVYNFIWYLYYMSAQYPQDQLSQNNKRTFQSDKNLNKDERVERKTSFRLNAVNFQQYLFLFCDERQGHTSSFMFGINSY